MTAKQLLDRYAEGDRNFGMADLIMADLSRSNLFEADLSGANLSRANLSVANLSGANLSMANLSMANLNEANLSGADLDYSSWPLWCGSVGVKIDSRISRQLVYHALCNMPEEDKKEFLSDPFGYANTFYRVSECGVIK